MTTATMTSKGQIVIPAEIRRRLKIEKGTRLSVTERGGQIVLQPMDLAYFKRMAGCAGQDSGIMEFFFKEKAAEKLAEDRKLEKWLKKGDAE